MLTSYSNTCNTRLLIPDRIHHHNGMRKETSNLAQLLPRVRECTSATFDILDMRPGIKPLTCLTESRHCTTERLRRSCLVLTRTIKIFCSNWEQPFVSYYSLNVHVSALTNSGTGQRTCLSTHSTSGILRQMRNMVLYLARPEWGLYEDLQVSNNNLFHFFPRVIWALCKCVYMNFITRNESYKEYIHVLLNILSK